MQNYSSFLDALTAAGITPAKPLDVLVDGKVHRFDVDGRSTGKKHGWYILHTDGADAWGAFGDWKTGLQSSWALRQKKDVSKAEWAALQARMEAVRKQAAAEAEQMAAKAKSKAASLWGKGNPVAADHPYIQAKCIRPVGAVQLRQMLLIPLHRAGELVSLQVIQPNGSKTFLTGGRTGGAYTMLGQIEADKPLLICEGWATGCTLHQAVGYPVAVAFNAGNLLPVAKALRQQCPEALRQQCPEAMLILCADDDHQTAGNPGLTKAQEAAKAAGGLVAIPAFPEGSKKEGMTDWNDLASACGISAVSEHLHVVLRQGEFLLYRQYDKGINGQEGEKGQKEREKIVETKSAKSASPENGPVEDSNEAEKTILEREAVNQATALVTFALEQMNLFHDNNHDVFTECKTTGVVRRLESKAFKQWLVAAFYTHCAKSARAQSVSEALVTLSGLGREEGPEEQVFIRTAACNGRYYIDLCRDKSSQAVEIQAGSWRVVDKPPVKFFRTESMQELPLPLPGGNLSCLWEAVNVPPESRDVVVAWLAESLRPETPKPVLEIGGEQGSAKSTTQTNLKRLLDPNACDLRAAPKTVEDCYIAAQANWMVSYENISHLHHSIQDALCTIATGGGFATRKFYTNNEESVISVRRPILLNGISDCVTRQDLVDRTISVEAPVIRVRQETIPLLEQYEADRADILGGILDLFAAALALLPGIRVPEAKRPRLIEFVKLGMAMKQAAGGNPDDFLHRFLEDRKELIQRTLDASPVAVAIVEYMETNIGMTAPAKAIAAVLERYRPQGAESWPKTPKGMGDAIKRAAPALRQLGIDCRRLPKEDGHPKWQIRHIDNVSVEV